MVLLGGDRGSASGPLPPLGSTLAQKPDSTRLRSAPPAKPRGIAPLIKELSTQLSQGEARAKGAVGELAMLASRSLTACVAVADAKLEAPLAKILKTHKDPHTMCWTMSVLANCASIPASRERQAVAVPALCKLVQSKDPQVQHAATLHLATLSHSAHVQQLFGANYNALRALHDIEKRSSKVLSMPGRASLQQEASTYARWALRTAQGRNYKPAYMPKTDEELEAEGAVAIQARVRSSFVANQYRAEMKQRRAAATILQAGYRGHTSRAGVAAELLVQAPAVALLQGWVRGRAHRKEMAKQKAREQREMDLAAARIQGGYRGRQLRSRRAAAATEAEGEDDDEGGAAGRVATLTLELQCEDGKLPLTLQLGDPDEDVMMTLYLKCKSDDPDDRKTHFYALELCF